MKVIKRGFIPLFLLPIVLFLLLIWLNNNVMIFPYFQSTDSVGSPTKVLSYKPEIQKELNKYQLGDFTNVLLAIMYQESRGEGNDPMQASESAGLKRNAILNPSESIEQGVSHFYQMYVLGKKNNVDMDTIIQSYNMGPGYIHFVAENGFKHTEELAKAYSKMQVEKNPTMYTCGGFKGNFRYPYCFGDFTYASKVQQKLALVQKSMQTNNAKIAFAK